MRDLIFSLLYSISSSFGGKWLEGRRVWRHFLAGKSEATGRRSPAGCRAMELPPPIPLPTTHEGAATAPECTGAHILQQPQLTPSRGDVLMPAPSKAPMVKTAGSAQLPDAPVRFPEAQSTLTSIVAAAGNDARDITHPLLDELPTRSVLYIFFSFCLCSCYIVVLNLFCNR